MLSTKELGERRASYKNGLNPELQSWIPHHSLLFAIASPSLHLESYPQHPSSLEISGCSTSIPLIRTFGSKNKHWKGPRMVLVSSDLGLYRNERLEALSTTVESQNSLLNFPHH
jgi:hypothetical protein